MKACLCILLLAAASAALAQTNSDQSLSSTPARDLAQSHFDNDEARKGLAALADAARKAPDDRIIATMLYTAIRNHAWHFSQILPLRHKGPVTALVFSPDAKKLASGSEYGDVIVASTETGADPGQNQRVALQLPDSIVGLAFSADGQHLAVVSRAGWIRILETTGSKVTFTAPRAAVSTTAYCSAMNADLIAAGMENGAIQVVDIANGKIVLETKPTGKKVVALSLSRSGMKLAAGFEDETVQVWKTGNGKPAAKEIHNAGDISSLDFSSDERYLAVAGGSGILKLWDPEAGVEVLPGMDCGAPVEKVSVSPDGSLIATILKDNSVVFHDAVNGKKIDFDLRTDSPFNDLVWFRSGLRLATASQGGNAAIWTMYQGDRLGEPMPHDGPIISIAASDDSKLLASGGVDGQAQVWRVDDGIPMPTVRNHSARVRTAFYSADGNHLVTASEDGTALQWASGQVKPFGPALIHDGKVNCAVFNKDASLILTCDDTGSAWVWDSKTGRAEGTAYRHGSPVTWVDFHPDGQRFATASGPEAFVWDVSQHSKPVAVLKPPGSSKKSIIKCVRYSPDGKWLVTVSTDGEARKWNAETFQDTGIVIRRHAPLCCARYSPDGSLLVVTGEDSQAIVYDAETWKPVGTPVVAPGPVFSAFITPDNRLIGITAYLVNAAQFFEIKTGSPLEAGLALPSQPTCIDFLVKDKVVAVACDDGSVRAIDSPFVDQDVPGWFCNFAEKIAGVKKTGVESFERVESGFNDLTAYLTPEVQADKGDFSVLARWRLATGSQRPGMPRFVSTLALNIEQRVDNRSLSDLFECYDALPGDALVAAALSLYWPNPRHGEYLADFALKTPDASPLARCFAAGTLINAGRSQEAKAVIDKAVAEAPNDFRVLRRAAKFAARMSDKAKAIDLFEKSLSLVPNNFETRRTYAWALYNFKQPKEAEAQFHLAEEIVGKKNDDLIAGMCLCAKTQKNNPEAQADYSRLVALNPDWAKAAFISGLRGWTASELGTLEQVRRDFERSGKH